jgi:3-hydroxyacyl-[acyl-carrier-protein] dehydratase
MEEHGMIAALDTERIQELIPHRHPFLLIDRVVDIVPDVRATGIKHVSGDEYFFRGHFPNYPVMPAVLIIEAMAQTAGVLGGCTIGTDRRTLFYFTGVDHARFRFPVTPGDTLELHVAKDRRHASVWRFTADARVGRKVVAEATFTAVNMGRVNPMAGGPDRQSFTANETSRSVVVPAL